MKLTKIGLRNVKTAIAVGIALLVKVILILIFGNEISRIIYTPFFGGIAAAYSMHMDKEASLKQARIRTIGSLFGGLYGMVILIIIQFLFIQVLNIDTTSILYYILDYVIVGIAIIPMIQMTVVSKKTYATWIACLTYLSVTVSIRNDFDDFLGDKFNMYIIAIIFAFNRILSTIIGVLISLAVNLAFIPRKKNSNILFVSSLDNAVLNQDKEIVGFTKYKINHLVNKDCKLTFATTRTQSSLNRIFDDINLKLPLISMNGSALYNPKSRQYLSIDNINNSTRLEIESLLKEKNINSFGYVVDDDVLQVYHNAPKNEAEKKYYKDRKNKFFDNYVKGYAPEYLNVAFYVIIEKRDVIEKLVNEINSKEYSKDLDLFYYEYEIPGYYYLKINSSSCSKESRLRELKDMYNVNFVVVFGSGESDIKMMEEADLSFALANAPKNVIDAATKVIESNSSDDILKTIEKIYHKRNLEKYKEKMKNENCVN